jgi:hypothetical protein
MAPLNGFIKVSHHIACGPLGTVSANQKRNRIFPPLILKYGIAPEETAAASVPTSRYGLRDTHAEILEMPSSAERTFSIFELAEHIIIQLNDPVEIIRAQRVCRTWRDVIQTSPALQEACWYQSPNTRDAQMRSISGGQTWKLNPAFNRIGVSISKHTHKYGQPIAGLQEKGDFSLEEDIYDKPGSWTTMLATQPSCQRMVVECYSDYSGDETMYTVLGLYCTTLS